MRLDLFLKSQELLNAGAGLHAFKMRTTIFKAREIKPELAGAAEAPEKMCVGRREVIEKILTPGQQTIGKLEAFKDEFCREPAHAFFCARLIADLRR